jgi:hypothetical protein
MAKPKLTLWLLNRVVGWNRDLLLATLMDRFDVELGRRVRAKGSGASQELQTLDLRVNDGEDGAPGELMHEGANLGGAITAYDEYFMPIPLKCAGTLGTPFWIDVASPDGLNRLAELGQNLANRFPPGNEFNPSDAKAKIGPHFGEVRMNLVDRSIGYYELLQRASEASGAQNVLIGYSQGGTVARYLAFLDEHVAQPEKRCIHSVITVQSPNRGSPVASKQKEVDVSRAFLAILLSLPKWLPDAFRNTSLWSFLGDAEKRNSLISFVNGLLDAELAAWPVSDKNKRLRTTWLSARKWLSGLSGLEDLAFWDLDPARVSEVGSVLHGIATYPLKTIQHGAIIGTDNRLHDLVGAFLHDSPWYVHLVAWFASSRIDALVGDAEDIYKSDTMSFPAGTPGTVASEYEKGIARGTYGLTADLPIKAHDFVIPAASQLLIPTDSPAHLGNLVNPDASHLTGAMEWDAGDGKNDEELALELLRRLREGGGSVAAPSAPSSETAAAA